MVDEWPRVISAQKEDAAVTPGHTRGPKPLGTRARGGERAVSIEDVMHERARLQPIAGFVLHYHEISSDDEPEHPRRQLDEFVLLERGVDERDAAALVTDVEPAVAGRVRDVLRRPRAGSIQIERQIVAGRQRPAKDSPGVTREQKDYVVPITDRRLGREVLGPVSGNLGAIELHDAALGAGAARRLGGDFYAARPITGEACRCAVCDENAARRAEHDLNIGFDHHSDRDCGNH